MDNQFNTPAQVIEGNINTAVTKANLPIGKMILLAIWAGAFVAIGANSSSVAAHSVQSVGVARALAGTIFPVGLLMIILIGGELFTGNCLMTMSALEKKITWGKMFRNLVVVYFANLAGSLVVAVLGYFSGQFNYSGGALGAYTINVAVSKASIKPGAAFASGILCNVLVCLAILLAATSKDIIGKIFACFFPIFAFVTAGFEHCVANMYYIPAGLLAKLNPQYVDKARELYNLTDEKLSALSVTGMIRNLVPVTLGNFVGGAVCVGVMAYLIYRKDWTK